MPDRTDMVEVTHNVWVKPSSIDGIRFAAAPRDSKDLPPCPEGMSLQVCFAGAWLTVTWFDGSKQEAWSAAQDRMRELIQRVDAANRSYL